MGRSQDRREEKAYQKQMIEHAKETFQNDRSEPWRHRHPALATMAYTAIIGGGLAASFLGFDGLVDAISGVASFGVLDVLEVPLEAITEIPAEGLTDIACIAAFGIKLSRAYAAGVNRQLERDQQQPVPAPVARQAFVGRERAAGS